MSEGDAPSGPGGFEPTGFAAFDRLAGLFRATRALLDAALRDPSLPEGGAALIADAVLPHVEQVAIGFRATLRAHDGDLAELRALVRAVGLAAPPASRAEVRAALAEALLAQTGTGGRRALLTAPAEPLTAVGHARVVWALMPHTPTDEVHFPVAPRTYGDIPVPRTPGELATRIEELERELWSVATGHGPRDRSGAYRRTYGFFDTAVRLSDGGLRLAG
jgi:hypothetical protein